MTRLPYISPLYITDFDERFIEIMHQDGVRGYNGQFIESEDERFRHFFTDERCYMYGLFEENKLHGVLVAEQLSNNGSIVWYIAVHPEEHRKGYGKQLLSYFENICRMDGINWIYLTASLTSLDFYKEMGYETAGIHLIEHVKNLK
jgi:GNAT superfamily N-acetyltransferase